MQDRGRAVAPPALTQQKQKRKHLKRTFLTSVSSLMIMQIQVGVHLFMEKCQFTFWQYQWLYALFRYAVGYHRTMTMSALLVIKYSQKNALYENLWMVDEEKVWVQVCITHYIYTLCQSYKIGSIQYTSNTKTIALLITRQLNNNLIQKVQIIWKKTFHHQLHLTFSFALT